MDRRFECYDVAREFIHAVGPVIEQVQKRDRGEADQLRRASAGVLRSIAEARKRVGKDRKYLFRVAAGSGDEARAGLEIAVAWGYTDERAASEPLELLDRVLAMLWRLSA